MNARDLSNHLAALLRKEREAMADFLLALADFDDKKTWRELGHTSLFCYLRRELGLSAGAAQHRKTAVELVRQFPAVETALRQGRLCLSSVCELAKVVTSDNVAEVLPRFFGLSRREAEAVAAAIHPAPAIPRREVVMPLRATADAPSADIRDEIAPAEPTATEVHPGGAPGEAWRRRTACSSPKPSVGLSRTNPARQRLATSREPSVARPWVTTVVKRTQGVREPRD